MTFLFKYKLLYTSYVKIIKEPTFSSILLTTNRKPKLGVHLYSSGKQREKMIHISLPLARQRRVDNFVLVSGYEQKIDHILKSYYYKCFYLLSQLIGRVLKPCQLFARWGAYYMQYEGLAFLVGSTSIMFSPTPPFLSGVLWSLALGRFPCRFHNRTPKRSQFQYACLMCVPVCISILIFLKMYFKFYFHKSSVRIYSFETIVVLLCIDMRLIKLKQILFIIYSRKQKIQLTSSTIQTKASN